VIYATERSEEEEEEEFIGVDDVIRLFLLFKSVFKHTSRKKMQ
jgi:hypothetical protein